MEHASHTHRFAEQIFESHQFLEDKYAIQDIVKRAPFIVREGKRVIVAKKYEGKPQLQQSKLNEWFAKEFLAREWEPSPNVIGDPDESGLAADFRKNRIQVEVQFGNIARAFYDLFKMQAGYMRDQMDVGVLILPMQNLSGLCGSNIAYFERVARELPYAKMSITLPIWVIGITPHLEGSGAGPAKPPAQTIPTGEVHGPQSGRRPKQAKLPP